MSRIEDRVDRCVSDGGTRIALWHGGKATTYGLLQQRARECARALASVGCGNGCPVGVLLPNGSAFVQAVLGTWYSGNVVVPLSVCSSKQAVGRIADRLGIRAFLTDAAGCPQVADLAGARILVGETVACVRAADGGKGAANLPGWSESHAVVFLTSGTTGAPKIVALTHHNILNNLASAEKLFPRQTYEKTYVCLPMCHSYGFTLQLLLTLCNGGGLHIGHGHKLGTDLARELVASQCSSVLGVPSVFRMLADGVRRCGLVEGASRVEVLVSGAAAMTEDVLSDMRGTFRNARILLTYGLSEASPLVTVLPPSWLDRKGCSIGLPVDGVELRLVTAEGEPITRPGRLGEILIRGGSVIEQYLGSPEANATSFRDGFLRTGDIAVMDSDGCLYFRGRAKELINRAGVKIYPCDIEEVLRRRDEIEQAAVVPRPHPLLGEVPFAFVKLAGGKSKLDWPEIKQWCASYLAAQEIPVGIQVVESFPTTATGKIRKAELAAMLAPSGPENAQQRTLGAGHCG